MTGAIFRRGGLLLLATGWLLAGLLPGLVAPVRGAEYTLRSRATYQVEPGHRRVLVSVRVTFENTTPDPDGEFSVFEVIDLALQPGSTRVTARDRRGALTVRETQRNGYVQASVRPRRPVRYEDRASFTLTYRIPDRAAPGTRVRPSLVAFPVWSFGTSGEVAVTLPGSFEVSAAGDELIAERATSGWVLESGEIEDPARWVAQVVAAGQAGHDVVTRAVPLDSGTVDLQVRAWADDGAWRDRTLELVSAALPLMEAELGVPYPGVGPLVVEESATGAADLPSEAVSEGTRLLAGYDQPGFMLLHQLAHVWLTPNLVADRWITEGFASRGAARVAAQLPGDLAADLPYQPVRRRQNLEADAFPLISWGAGPATAEQDAFAYAASWAVATEVQQLMGPKALRAAWARIAAGLGPYAPVTEEGPAASPPPSRQPIDSRSLLDHLEAVSDADVAAVFGEWVLDDDSARLLPDRAAAREEFATLLATASGWGAPDPVVVDLEAWRFDSARQRIEETADWLLDRDELAAAAEEAGLSLPQRLQDRYRTGGGSADARSELDAERAVVTAYQATLQETARERGIVERIGLLGGPDPDQLLRSANGLFAEGDLRAAADAVDEARSRLEHAGTEGLVRIGAAVLVLVALVLLAWSLARRGRPRPIGDRTDSDYTAAP